VLLERTGEITLERNLARVMLTYPAGLRGEGSGEHVGGCPASRVAGSPQESRRVSLEPDLVRNYVSMTPMRALSARPQGRGNAVADPS
jgi:hypothetical protein